MSIAEIDGTEFTRFVPFTEQGKQNNTFAEVLAHEMSKADVYFMTHIYGKRKENKNV